MKKGWIIASNGSLWCLVKKGIPFRVPPSWDESWENDLKSGVAIYDPFFGYDIDGGEFVCTGIVITAPFCTLDGWTVELEMKEKFKKEAPIQLWFPELKNPKSVRFIKLCDDEIDRICQFMSDNSLKLEFERLINLAAKDNGRETIQSIFAERYCSEKESREAEKVLFRLLELASEQKGKNCPQLEKDIVENLRYLMFLLHMENAPSTEWQKLWEKLYSALRDSILGTRIQDSTKRNFRENRI